MDFVSFETAVRLKEAGFSQHMNGFFYCKKLNCVRVMCGDVSPVIRVFETASMVIDEDAFAPTATDILRELPDYWFVSVSTTDPHGLYRMCIDPEELALEWLAIHEKK